MLIAGINVSVLDNVVFLLSSDFLLPFWDLLELQVDDSEKLRIREGCREIIGQIMSGTVKGDYFLTDFSKERVQKTFNSFVNLFKNQERFKESFLWKLLHLDDESSQKLTSISSTLMDLSSERFKNSKLSLEHRQKIKSLWNELDLNAIDFEKLIEVSNTDHDAYLKGLKPDDETALADDLYEFLTLFTYKRFCEHVHSRFSVAEVDALIDMLSAEHLLSTRNQLETIFRIGDE